MNNLVFISGPHGAGKTTLVERLQKEYNQIIVPELKTTTPKFHTNPSDRQKLKLSQKAIESFEALEIAREHPDKIIIGNRCRYDCDAYSLAFHKLRWITQEDHERLLQIGKFIYTAELYSPLAIILNPPFEIVRERLQGRWKKEEKKWNEDDMDYCKAACSAYEHFEGQPRILYLRDSDNIERIIEWMERNIETKLFARSA